MKNFSLLLLLFITSICAFTINGCEVKHVDTWEDLDIIVYQDILLKNEERYYVLCYSTTCDYCEELLPTIISYNKKEDKTVPIYVLNTSDKINNDGIMAPEEYEYFSYIGTEDYTDIMLENVPALIIVEDGKVDNLISSQTTDRPKSEIEYLLTK